MADQVLATSPDAVFKSRVNSLSAITATLGRSLSQIENSSINTADLSIDLGRFRNSLIFLTPHVETNSESNDNLCDASSLTELLKNAETCLDRIHTILARDELEGSTMSRYLQQSEPRRQMKHLRARLNLCRLPLRGPVLLASVYALPPAAIMIAKGRSRDTVRGSLGSMFSVLALQAISNWIDVLTKRTILFARDDAISQSHSSSSHVAGTSSLLMEREELVKILQSMIGTAMKMLHTTRRETNLQAAETVPPERPYVSRSALPSGEAEIEPRAVLDFQRLSLEQVHRMSLSVEPLSPPQYESETSNNFNRSDLSSASYSPCK